MSLPHQQSAQSGVTPFSQSGYQNGASSPRQNAMAYRQAQNDNQQRINGNKSGGSKRKKRQRGGEGRITVPSFSSPGPPVSGPGQNANSNSAGANTTSSQSSANAVCDKCIGVEASKTPDCQSPTCNPQSGGGTCNGAGLIGLNQTWGCMSGGKSRRKRRMKRKVTKKKNTKRKNKKSKKTKKRKYKK
jgi:hypothetical protein